MAARNPEKGILAFVSRPVRGFLSGLCIMESGRWVLRGPRLPGRLTHRHGDCWKDTQRDCCGFTPMGAWNVTMFADKPFLAYEWFISFQRQGVDSLASVSRQLRALTRKRKGECTASPWQVPGLGLEFWSSASFSKTCQTAQETPQASQQPASECWQSTGFPAHMQISALNGKPWIKGSLCFVVA